MKTNNKKTLEALTRIKHLFKLGRLSFDDAKFFATPHLKDMNDRMAELAKERGERPRGKATFTSFMR